MKFAAVAMAISLENCGFALLIVPGFLLSLMAAWITPALIWLSRGSLGDPDLRLCLEDGDMLLGNGVRRVWREA